MEKRTVEKEFLVGFCVHTTVSSCAIPASKKVIPIAKQRVHATPYRGSNGIMDQSTLNVEQCPEEETNAMPNSFEKSAL
jgi:hypothetical protein